METMAEYFDPATDFVLHQEGGYVDNPKDPGGATFKGVSLRAVVGLRDASGQLEFDLDGDGDVDKADILKLKELWEAGDHSKVVEFYRERYWNAVKAGEIRWPYCLCLYDAAVNHGPKAAVVLIQKAFGVPADGVMGPQTLRAVNAKPLRDQLTRYFVRRARLYFDLSVARGDTFFDGWMKRLFDLEAESLRRI